MNRVLYFVLIITMSFGFYGCNDDDDTKREVFVWNGDWNNSNDPNYKPDGYNPILGLWRQVDKNVGLSFTDDFKAYKITFEVDGYTETIWRDKYLINDLAFKLTDYEYYMYKIEGDILYITPQRLGDALNKEWHKLQRVQE
ncbi:MAG: hypothetical protein E6767_09430 [Dysgonomonas sp.]|nr:hypothetical protein [Dysgonomonas sp.]